MSRQVTYILTLTDALIAHEGVSHWTLSKRLSGKGDFLDRLQKGGDVRTATSEEMMRKIRADWPDDLEWPESVPFPVFHHETATPE